MPRKPQKPIAEDINDIPFEQQESRQCVPKTQTTMTQEAMLMHEPRQNRREIFVIRQGEDALHLELDGYGVRDGDENGQSPC
jgi:hypothetical protein